MKALRILTLEDDPLDAELVHASLTEGGIPCEMTRVQTREEFVAALEDGNFDLVLSDYSLPSFDGLSALQIAREIRPEVPFIFISGAIGEETAIESLKAGATDYVLKHRMGRLVPAVRRAVREVEERTERLRAEDALRASEQRLRLAVESTELGMWDYDPMTGELNLDERAKEIFGLSPEAEVDYEAFLARVHPDDRAWVDRMLRRALEFESGGSYGMEYRTAALEGGVERWVAARGRAFFDETRAPYYFVGTVLDITEQKRAEEALREIREAERNRMARELHDGVLQDLSYTAAAMEVSRIKAEGTGLEEELELELGDLRRAVDGLREAIYDLSMYRHRDQSIEQLLGSLVELNRQRAPGLSIELEAEEGFFDGFSERTSLELLRVVQEALTNVRRHSGARNVVVSLRTEGDDRIAEISDDGRGFDPEVPAGIGLRSMHERAQALGGELTVESEPGEGTRVRLRAHGVSGGS